MLQLISSRFENCVSFDGKGENHTALPVLRGSSSRPRRVSMQKKLDIVDAVANAPALRNPSQFVTVEAVLNKRNGVMDEPVRGRSALRCVQDKCYQYWLSGRKMWHGAHHVSCALDAGRVDGDDMQQMAFCSIETEQCIWGPPQVHFTTVGFGGLKS